MRAYLCLNGPEQGCMFSPIAKLRLASRRHEISEPRTAGPKCRAQHLGRELVRQWLLVLGGPHVCRLSARRTRQSKFLCAHLGRRRPRAKRISSLVFCCMRTVAKTSPVVIYMNPRCLNGGLNPKDLPKFGTEQAQPRNGHGHPATARLGG